MRISLLALVPIVFIRCGLCLSKKQVFEGWHCDNLYDLLKWIHDFYLDYTSRKTEHEDETKGYGIECGTPEGDFLEANFPAFIEEIVSLKKLIVNDNVHADISNLPIVDSYVQLSEALYSMEIGFNELTPNIQAWKAESGEETLIIESEPMLWFIKQGFPWFKLNAASIGLLEQQLMKINGDDQLLNRYVKHFATYVLLNSYQGGLLSNCLAMLVLGTFPELTNNIKGPAAESRSVSQPVADELVKRLVYLGSADSPLWECISFCKNKNGLSFSMAVMRRATIFKEHINGYIQLFVSQCNYISNTAKTIRGLRIIIKENELIDYMKEEGFEFYRNRTGDEHLLRLINALVNEASPIMKLCNAVRNFRLESKKSIAK